MFPVALDVFLRIFELITKESKCEWSDPVTPHNPLALCARSNHPSIALLAPPQQPSQRRGRKVSAEEGDSLNRSPQNKKRINDNNN